MDKESFTYAGPVLCKNIWWCSVMVSDVGLITEVNQHWARLSILMGDRLSLGE